MRIINNGGTEKMNRKLERIMKNYWSISKIVGVLFTLWNYGMWTEPFNIVKAVLIIIGVSVAIFLTINLLDMIVGLVVCVCKKIHRYFYDKRLLKGFLEQKEDEV